MARLVFHVDVNSAYLSWEAARRVANGEPDIRLSGIEMHQMLFCHNRFGVPQAARSAPRGWFPLPLHIPEPDSF